MHLNETSRFYIEPTALKIARARARIPHREIASRYGCCQSNLAAVFRRIRAGRPVSVITAGKLAAALGCEVDDLLEVRGNRERT